MQCLCVQDPDKQKEVEELLGSLESEKFAQLVALGKCITDYKAGGPGAEDAAAPGDTLDDAIGVAVEFEGEDEEDEDSEVDEVVVRL